MTLRRFFCRSFSRKDIDLPEGAPHGNPWPAGKTLIMGYRNSEEPDPEDKIREEVRALSLKCCAWPGEETDVELFELPYEEAVTAERILAEPAIPDDYGFKRRDWPEIFNSFMETITWSWVAQRDTYSEDGGFVLEEDFPITVERRLRIQGKSDFFQGYSLHLRGVAFAVVVHQSQHKSSDNVEVFIVDAPLAAQAALLLLQARMAAMAVAVSKGLTEASKADPKAPIIAFDDEMIAFFDGKIQRDGRAP